ncbi:endonuclease/exonuclease/phosphatase family protein [Daejeonella oryzae]|uniref:endonuclease/exonuclease/phosphatase family protein n=1 Tax=Daejeonella oryzae TaxID=1122943 RepID=UPI00040DCF62|nr:endonuclease/exonuclease/phosphatase family protein [Daejeonella oryzae]
METLKDIILGAGYLVILITLIPFIRHDFWIFRVFEYPRIQKLILNVFLFVSFAALFGLVTIHDKVFTTLLLGNIGYLTFQIWPFTRLGNKQLLKLKTHTPDKQIGLFIGNVYQYNRKATDYLKCINSKDPDLVMLVETDKWWEESMHSLKETYPHHLLVPLENTYGMLLYSKFELVDPKVKYLVEDGIPSVHACIKLPSGDLIRFHGLHPTPPVPTENPRSTERDKEILMVGKSAKNSKLPVIVAGDLNDVAWSYTTELFSRTSGLLDPRRGRGFFNTFHAKYLFMRFPLDHVFCSNDFTLIHIERMPNCGSDHFPMYIKLQYSPKAAAIQEEPHADQADLETAQEKINKPT